MPHHCGMVSGGATIRHAQMLAVTMAVVAGCSRSQPPPPSPAPPAVAVPKPVASPDIDRPAASQRLYVQHCAACHGERGDSQGIAAKLLFPRPRDFRAGRFRLTSTDNGIPTKADLDAVLVRGMPGSSMPPWAHLSQEDRALLVEQVMQFRRDGARDIELMLAEQAGDELSEQDMQAAIARVTTPGKVLEVPPLPDPTDASIEGGRKIYLTKGCAACHGNTGKGDGQQKMVDAEGLPTRPRDLTLGIFKGNPDAASVYRRIWAGMPGSPMPASKNLTPEQVADLVHFTLSLSDEATRKSVVLRRERIVASRVQTAPTAVDDPAWSDIEAVVVNTTPLWWRDDFEPDLQVQALHDSSELAIRLSWRDDTPDRHVARSESFADAAAIEFYRGPAEPFLGMGSGQAPVEVWMWKAEAEAGPAEIEDVNPSLVVDVYPLAEKVVTTAEYDRPGTKTDTQPLVSFPARAAGNLVSTSAKSAGSSALEGAGPGTLTFRLPMSQDVSSTAVWNEGVWSLVLRRSLTPSDDVAGRVVIEPGTSVSASFALWDGAHQDRNGKKRITIWQDLVLE